MNEFQAVKKEETCWAPRGLTMKTPRASDCKLLLDLVLFVVSVDFVCLSQKCFHHTVVTHILPLL